MKNKPFAHEALFPSRKKTLRLETHEEVHAKELNEEAEMNKKETWSVSVVAKGIIFQRTVKKAQYERQYQN